MIIVFICTVLANSQQRQNYGTNNNAYPSPPPPQQPPGVSNQQQNDVPPPVYDPNWRPGTPQYPQAAPPPPPQYVAEPPLARATVLPIPVVRTYHRSSETDSLGALFIFLLGWCFFFPWLAGFLYIRSPNTFARGKADEELDSECGFFFPDIPAPH
jgi:hypothetical protein